jgi:uncharacterized tellurite resistance protein B-like protein
VRTEPDRDTIERLKVALLEAIQEFLAEPTPGSAASALTPQVPAAPRKVHVAVAALLLQMTRADHDAVAEEREAVARALASLLGATTDEARGLIGLADLEGALQLPLQKLVDVVNAGLSVEERKQLVQALWSVAFADAEILAHEEYLVRKVCDLLQLSRADLIEAKLRAKEEFR